jgi:GGDEF domain-containing protein
MLSNKRPLRQQRAQRFLLDADPSISDFHNFLEIAHECRGSSVDFSWKTDEQVFTVRLSFSNELNSPVWKLYKGNKEKTLVWEHESCDIPLIFNLVATETNMHQSSVIAERALCAVKLNVNMARTADTLYNFHPSNSGSETPAKMAKSDPSNVVRLIDRGKESGKRVKPAIANPPEASPNIVSLPELVSAETGLLTYPAFLFMLEREFYLAWRANRGLSILIFSVNCPQATRLGVRSLDGPIKEYLSLVMKTKRKYDVLAHYKDDLFALILPQTAVSGAKGVARRMLKALEAKSNPFGASLGCSFGAADVRCDGRTLSMVLVAAEQARNTAEEIGPKILAYRDLLIDKAPHEQETYQQQCVLGNLNHAVYGSMVEGLKKEVSSPDTGIYILPIFQHFLQHDYRRAVRENQSLSTLSFSIDVEGSNLDAQQQTTIKKKVLHYIARIKRRTDVLSEYSDGRYILILPDTPVTGAHHLAKRINEIIEPRQAMLTDGQGETKLKFSALDAISNYQLLLAVATIT